MIFTHVPQPSPPLTLRPGSPGVQTPCGGAACPWVPNALAALIACLLMGATRCITLNSAYKSIQWPSLILIIGMMPFSTALQKTGGVELAAQGLLHIFGQAEPRLLLAALFALTAIIGLFVSNTATAVLMAPIALTVAQDLGASPYPFMMTIALAASAAFMTPVSSPVNTLVLVPGRYRFEDFVRIGVPFTFIALLITVLLVPVAAAAAAVSANSGTTAPTP